VWRAVNCLCDVCDVCSNDLTEDMLQKTLSAALEFVRRLQTACGVTVNTATTAPAAATAAPTAGLTTTTMGTPTPPALQMDTSLPMSMPEVPSVGSLSPLSPSQSVESIMAAVAREPMSPATAALITANGTAQMPQSYADAPANDFPPKHVKEEKTRSASAYSAAANGGAALSLTMLQPQPFHIPGPFPYAQALSASAAMSPLQQPPQPTPPLMGDVSPAILPLYYRYTQHKRHTAPHEPNAYASAAVAIPVRELVR
jgi:hypothetical protein